MAGAPVRAPALSPFASLLAAATMAGLVVMIIRSAGEPPSAAPRVDIAVEHAFPSTLDFTFGAKAEGGTGLLDFSQDGSGAIALSLPAGWRLREVRGGTMESVPAEPPTFGSRRYRVPPRVLVSFVIPRMPGGAQLHNLSKARLQARVRRIDLATGRAIENRTLLQEGIVTLW